jgi:AcrR family transcriptional regulator
MAGVREKKKKRTQDGILKAAKKLFIKKGYREARIEDIAAEAEVGVGTVYNYFGSKRVLLLEMMDLETTEILALGDKMITGAKKEPVVVLGGLIGIYLDAISTWDRKLLRDLVVSGIIEQSTGEELMKADYRLIEQVTGLVRNFQAEGGMDGSIEAERAALVLYSMLCMRVMMYMYMDSITLDLIKIEIQKDIELVFRGWKES